jgi:hypothetical protein
LFQIVRALNTAGGLARRLHGRQQKGNQDRDDRNDNKKFNQSESGRRTPSQTKLWHGGNLRGEGVISEYNDAA